MLGVLIHAGAHVPAFSNELADVLSLGPRHDVGWVTAKRSVRMGRAQMPSNVPALVDLTEKNLPHEAVDELLLDLASAGLVFATAAHGHRWVDAIGPADPPPARRALEPAIFGEYTVGNDPVFKRRVLWAQLTSPL